MLNPDAARELELDLELLPESESAPVIGATSAVPKSSGVRSSGLTAPFGSVRSRKLSHIRLSDSSVLGLVTAVLFVVAGWPLLLSDVPPYQDLPNHLATLTVIQNRSAYPEYVFNGFFKTNAALFSWLYFVSKVTGLNLAAKLFALVTLAANAIVIPRFVLHFTKSRARTVVASLFALPMIHNWFVSMGMLDFALAVPLSLALLIAIDRQRTERSWKAVVAILGFGFTTWYAHVFPLLVVHLLLALEVARQPGVAEKLRGIRTTALPLLPVTALALLSIGQHIGTATGPMTGFVDFQKLLPPWELTYNLWAEWFWGYSNLSLTSIVPCVLLAFFGIRGLRRQSRSGEPFPTFFSPITFVVLIGLYCFVPYMMTNWFHVNSRLIPFLWIGLLLYVPDSLPRPILAVLGVSGALYTAGMAVDYVRLDQERQEFSAGVDVVPEGAKLLPLLFEHKGVSSNTRNLLHMWGYYVVERRTSAPLLFAHSHSFPITYSTPPPIRFNHLVLESFAPEARTPAEVCHTAARFAECDALFASTWQGFYADATPRFDHLLLWAPTPEALAMVPKDYHPIYDRGRLQIFARNDVHPSTASR